MPNKYNNFIRGYVFGLSKANLTYSQIIKKCQDENISISKKGIFCILRDCNLKNLIHSPTKNGVK